MQRAVFLFAVFTAAFAQDFAVRGVTVTITPIRHASLMIQADGKVGYLDPAQGNFDNFPKADVILITDIHGDHFAPPIIEKLSKPETLIIAPEAVAKTLPTAKIIRNGETMTVGKWTVEAIPAYNMKRGPSEGKYYHDKGRGNGYVVSFSGVRFYFAGDTEGIPEMRALKDIEVAYIPMNLPYTMTPEEAADAVKAFHPKVVYPYHYRGSDLSVFQKALAGTGIDVRLAKWYD